MAAAARTSMAKPYPGSMRSLLRMNGYRGLATGERGGARASAGSAGGSPRTAWRLLNSGDQMARYGGSGCVFAMGCA